MPQRIHGRANSGDPTYVSWQSMLNRCRNPKVPGYARYGGRGIRVCDRWKTFAGFLADVGERPPGATLERIDAAGHYEPGNVRWATPTEQNRNTSRNRVIEFDGESKTLAEWAEAKGIPYATLRIRLGRWGVQRALTTPPEPKIIQQKHPTRTVQQLWWNIKNRCHNPKDGSFQAYGAKGVTMCDRWRKDRDAFVSDMGGRPSPTHSVDRIDNGKGYWCGRPDCPECGPLGREPNCRWATTGEQASNKTTSRFIEHDGLRLTVTQWAERLGVTKQAIHARLSQGWSDRDAVSVPFVKRKRRTPGEQPTCSVPGCDRQLCAKGMCTRHYQQNKRNAAGYLTF